MNAAEILNAVRQVGATLRVEGESLVASNASRVAPAIKAAKRATERATACNARRKGQFQMCRAADAGPYCSTNARIDRTEANSVEAQVTKRRLRLERQASQSIVCSS